ncbi:hypothetical protein KSP35_13780 [Aquihabitans sp. G128]|uniref:hypothetical protein n=1 Tax=Aquihabitans sp. G128 TaxID=2849779 RepID=UPI001C230C3E|nr:hypothetical protein [Aquihabitans sp. G128]QXC59466.1 hypothetical protein KSP35_13780 [Aquihabitans sp. G128]
MTQHNQGLAAAGCDAPALRWSAADAASARNRHHAVMSVVPSYVVKPSAKTFTFKGITRRPTEGSS